MVEGGKRNRRVGRGDRKWERGKEGKRVKEEEWRDVGKWGRMCYMFVCVTCVHLYMLSVNS